jgi:isoquinoline 1-oxidoreductase beta subunit
MTQLTRRQILKASASVAGGMMLPFHFGCGEAAEDRYLPDLGIEHEVNAWLLIEPDESVVIRIPRAEMGQGAFTALPMIVAEELECDWRNVRVERADVNRSLRNQRLYRTFNTGGSGAVRYSRRYLQEAGANARVRLLQAAAERWQVPLGECTAAQGTVRHAPSGKSTSFGSLAAHAARVSVDVESIRIKQPAEFKLIGQSKRRLDALPKVDGSAKFGIDVRLPGMLYAAIVHCPLVGGRLDSYDFDRIKGSRGVQRAVAFDAAVAVVADRYWRARSALDRMPVEWAAGAGGSLSTAQLDREFREALDGTGLVAATVGDANPALESAEQSLAADYQLPFLAHACMEPMNCSVSIGDGRVDIWLGTQNEENVVAIAAEALDVQTSSIYVHNQFLGGGFGRRANHQHLEEALEIARQVGAPVQLIWSREEDMRAGYYRPMAALRFEAGLDPDGMPIALRIHSVAPSVLEFVRPEGIKDGIDGTSVEGLANMPYAIPHRRIESTIRRTPVKPWIWRSVGSSQNAFALESFIDEMAEAAKRDALDFRRLLLADRPDFLHVLEVLAEKSNWGRTLPEGSAAGIALHECMGTIVGQVAEVTIEREGRLQVDRVVSVVDCGHAVNPLGIEAQIEGSVIFALTAALYGRMTIAEGRVVEGNFDTYPMLKLKDTPAMETHLALSRGEKWGGIGEPGVPPVAPAVCNAVYRITGRRIRTLPLVTHDLSWTHRSEPS